VDGRIPSSSYFNNTFLADAKSPTPTEKKQERV
jgi:hypothetical protein